MNKLGIVYTCYNEKKAIEYSLKILNSIYPDIKVYLASDGGLNYSYLEKEYNNLKTVVENDTFSLAKHINGDNFKIFENQIKIKNCILATINRLNNAIDYCDSEYILMMDPDTLVRGKLNIPDNVKLLGTRINKPFPEEYKNILKNISGAKVINCWGATPGIFDVLTYKKALNYLNNNIELLDKFTMSFYAMHAHDVLLPTLFALIGEEETFNPDVVECLRNPNWKNSDQPLVHQFRYYY
jgi:hypothetical protein